MNFETKPTQISTLNVSVDDSLHLHAKDGQVVVSSRYIAEKFGKRHDNVYRDIEGLLNFEDTPKEYFIHSQYQHTQNKQWYPEYQLTKDGFMLLAMGFTGQEALRWKLKYIDAFNRMDRYIREQKPLLNYKTELQEFDEVAKIIELSKKDKLIAVTSILEKHNMPTLGLQELIAHKHPRVLANKQNVDDAINYVCDHNPMGFSLKEYYKDYLVYCANNGLNSMGKNPFCSVVRQLGYESKATRVNGEVCKVWIERG